MPTVEKVQPTVGKVQPTVEKVQPTVGKVQPTVGKVQRAHVQTQLLLKCNTHVAVAGWSAYVPKLSQYGLRLRD
jgi:D-serine dehydratase